MDAKRGLDGFRLGFCEVECILGWFSDWVLGLSSLGILGLIVRPLGCDLEKEILRMDGWWVERVQLCAGW